VAVVNSKSRDKRSRLMKAQWQQEFYSAGATLLPQEVYLSLEYGRELGAEGLVDFFIAKYQWMIEILRDGMDIAAHERRFKAGGQYVKLFDSSKA